jgi:glycosyltransferase involved in cell wall biosynthesis
LGPDPVLGVTSGAVARLSVVIPCYRHAAELRRCLAGVLSQRAPVRFEVIVVDSGPDAEVARVAGQAGALVVGAAERLGPGEARNRGAREARGDVLLFLDADCVPEPGWLAAGLAAIEAGARLAGGPVLDAPTFHPVGVSDNLLQFAEFPRGRPDGSATHFPGCNLAIARADFTALGGFPAVHLPAGEDGAFSRSMRARFPDGLRFTRAMAVRHWGRTGFGEFLRHHERFGYCRAALDLSLEPGHRRLAARPLMTVPVAAKRLAFILGRGLAWDRGQLARTLLLLPVLAPGLIAWATGFRRGLATREAEPR